MKEYWKKFAALVDERNTRERILMFGTTIVVIGALMESLLLAPVEAQGKRITQELKNDQAEIAKLALQVQSLTREKGADPAATLKTRLAEVQSRQAELQRQIEAQSAELVAPDKMTAILEKMLAGNPNVQLVEAKTLPRTSVSFSKEPVKPAAAPGGPAKAGAPEEKKPAEIYRHGVQITVRGSYLSLLAYLKAIEALPTRMFWDQMSLTVGVYPTVTMRVVVYTISLDKVWLTV